VYHLVCSEYWNRRTFMAKLLQNMGAVVSGTTVSDMMDNIVDTLKRKEKPLIVLDVTLELAPGSRREIGALMEDLASRRREKQPLEYPSAGSTFKRPPGHFAAKLIEEAGLRGFSVGGAQVSEKHCGFVVNKGNATAADIYALITKVQEQVKRSSQVTLEPEVILLGF